MKKIYFLLLNVILLSSCAVNSNLKTTQRKMNRQAETSTTNTKLVNKPILADLEVGLKRETTTFKTTSQDIANSILMSGSSESKNRNFLVSASESMKNEARNRAQFKFMEEYKCDYLIDPIYKIETESQSGSSIVNITVEVYAYPAFYKRFSQPDSLPKSVFELGKLDNREIPLMTSAATTNKETSKTESGFMFSAGLSNLKADASGTLENTSSGISGNLGFYTLFPFGQKFGFRSEYLVSSRGLSFNLDDSSSGATITGSVKYRYFSIDVPLMLDFKATSNIHLNAGLSLNYTAIGRYKEDYTFEYFGSVTEYNESGKINGFEANLQSGFLLGATYQTDGSFGIGLRQQFGMGEDKWSTTQLVMGFRF